MADSKLTALTEITAPLSTDITYLVSDPGGTPAEKKMALSCAVDYAICNGRLTLATGVPVTTADQAAKTTVYFAPYKGNRIGLYDGSGAWTVLSFAELSLSLSGYTANKNYDIWVYNNSGTATLDSTIWTNDTTRATALAVQDGVLVKTGATDRRYVGTIRITGTTGQCEDSVTKRYVANYYNPVLRKLLIRETTNHTYTDSAWRAWNNSTTGSIIEFVCCNGEDTVPVTVMFNVKSNNTSNTSYANAGVDSTTGSQISPENCYVSALAANTALLISLSSHIAPAAGYHYIAGIEYGGANSADFQAITILAGIFG